MLRTLVPLRRTVATAVLALATGLAASSAAGQTSTLNFNGITDPDNAGIVYVQNCYTEAGYRVTAVGVPCTDPFALAVGSPANPQLYPGSPAIFLNDPTATMLEFTRVGGGLFSLSSIAFAPFLQGATMISLTGIRPSAANVFMMLPEIGPGGLLPMLTAFAPTGFTDLSALRITATHSVLEPYVLVDNVTLTASVVPEPATVTLFAIGLVGVAAAARRRRAAA